MEILGCYHPVTVTEIPSISHTSPPPEFTHCRPCSNVPQEQLNIDNCACSPSQSWDGKQCVMPSLCPCFDGPIKYSVGTMFHSQHNCSSCVCTLGGVSDCRSQTCPQCDHGFVTEAKSPQCQCSCKACDQGTRACHSSNVCLDETLWCNGKCLHLFSKIALYIGKDYFFFEIIVFSLYFYRHRRLSW